jgi:hypothetical protein
LQRFYTLSGDTRVPVELAGFGARPKAPTRVELADRKSTWMGDFWNLSWCIDNEFISKHINNISPQVASAKGYKAALGRLPCLWGMKANIYVDGFNLYFGSLKGKPWAVIHEFKKDVGLLNPQRHPSYMLKPHVKFIKQIRFGVPSKSQFTYSLCPLS